MITGDSMNVKRWIIFFALSLLILGLFLHFGCNKKTVNTRTMTPEEQFEYAKFFFDKRDYFKAKERMMMVVLNNQGHLISEKAQYYLAESYFNLKEYLLAVSEYEKLIKSMPRSDYVDDSRYKIGMCYYKLSPNYGLDQEYTKKAIYQFQVFLEEYPTSELKEDAELKLAECRSKLGRKSFKEGEQYRKMGIYPASIIAYEWVLLHYYDTDYVDDAQYWKGLCHIKLRQWADAEKSFQDLLNKYPQSKWAGRSRQMLKKAQKKITGK